MLVRNFPIDIHKMKEERAIFLSKVQATRKKCNEELIELQEKHSKNCRDVSYDENYLVYITEKYANRKHEILNLISNLETYEKRVNCVYNYYINLYRGNYLEKEMYEKTLINLLYKELNNHMSYNINRRRSEKLISQKAENYCIKNPKSLKINEIKKDIISGDRKEFLDEEKVKIEKILKMYNDKFEKGIIDINDVTYKELFEFSPIKIVNNILRYKNETININKDDTRVLQTA